MWQSNSMCLCVSTRTLSSPILSNLTRSSEHVAAQVYSSPHPWSPLPWRDATLALVAESMGGATGVGACCCGSNPSFSHLPRTSLPLSHVLFLFGIGLLEWIWGVRHNNSVIKTKNKTKIWMLGYSSVWVCIFVREGELAGALASLFMSNKASFWNHN